MIAHISIGARDIARARRFYDAALKPLGYSCLSSGNDSLGYGAAEPAFWVNAAAHPVPPDDRSGLHICFAAPSRAWMRSTRRRSNRVARITASPA
jgi:catechol 2,3-dioxygenase-like lactoylglutathione lyase family enzyme